MDRAVVIYRNSDGLVVGTWRGQNTIPTSPDPSQTYHEVTIAEFEQVTRNGLTYGNDLRWEVAGGVLLERTDVRMRLKFTPRNVEVQQGTAPPTVQVTLVDNAGVTIPTTGTIKPIILGKPVNIALVSGIGTLTIPTGRPADIVISDGPNYRVEAPLTIKVFALNTLDLS